MTDPRTPPDPDEFPAGESPEARAAFLLEYAVLAPSSHNSQPWAFAVDGGTVSVYADESRRLDVADPDGRELYLSVGCALENLVVAAERFGLDATVDYEQVGDRPPSSGAERRHAATVRLDSTASTPEPSAPFAAIPERHTNHRPFEPTPVPEAVLDRFERYAATERVGLEPVTDRAQRERVATLQTRADERQFGDPAYREELGHWIGTGALGANWLLARLGQLAVRHLDLGEREGRKNSELVTSAPVLVVLTGAGDAPDIWLRAGRAFERMWLAATSEGLALHPMSQILEVDDLRAELATLLGLEERLPLHLFRLGYAEPESTRTPRRPVAAVRL
jgi:nitroreductase